MTDDGPVAGAAGLGPRALPPKPPRTRWRTAAWLLLALVAVAGIAAGSAIVLERRSERLDRQARERRAAGGREAARLRRLQAPHRGRAPELRSAAGASAPERLAARAALVRAVEGSILRDARRRAAAGELRGPIVRVRCGPFERSPAAVPDDRVITRAVGRYDCLAVRRSEIDAVGGGTANLGYPFVTALDFSRFTYVWCRNTPPQSERGEALAFVRLDRACLAARGRAVGTGYEDVPDAGG